MFSNLQIICLQMVSLFISFCFFVLNSSATNDHGSIVGLSLSGFSLYCQCGLLFVSF